MFYRLLKRAISDVLAFCKAFKWFRPLGANLRHLSKYVAFNGNHLSLKNTSKDKRGGDYYSKCTKVD